MSQVKRTTTVVEVVEVDDGEGFNPLVALGIARGLDAWREEVTTVLYEVTEGDQIYQMSGRKPREVSDAS